MAAANSTSKPAGPVKRLVELLQDQQEPFTLDVYISERKYMKNSESRNGPNLHSSTKSSTRTCSSKVERKRTRLPYGSRTLRLLVDALISYKNCRKLSDYNCQAQNGGGERVSKMAKKHQHNAEPNQLSYNSEQNHGSSSQSTLKLQHLRELKAASYSKLQLGYTEDWQATQPSIMWPILSGKATEDSIFSAYLSELLVQSLNEKQNGLGTAELEDIRSGSSQCLKAKRVFMQTKQLVFDCVKEAVDNHGRSGRRKKNNIKEVLGTEELGKVICEQIYSWGKQCGDVTNITQLINLDFSYTVEEWGDLSPIIRDFGIEIGDAILDDIVTEMIYSELYRN
ncbi:hypothetical protein F0562_020801 [Nyssa sinensis]|uniref:DUF4378 domain-containing protein n=1 Tax=Nyssa sinensis TaxID=561372 RepID=A0A5J5BSC7_9ASTE|nr:hypothetical protein F0562_020801 [Nyssa sinensis]